MWSVGLCVTALIVICISHCIFKWRHPKCNGTLPPGSMGFPLIGETLQMITPGHSLDVLPFIKQRLERYGPIFRTSVAGQAIVVSADPEFNYFILQQEGRLVESWYLDLFAKVFKQGENRPDKASIHKYMRKIALNHFGFESLKVNLMSQLEEMVDKTLSTWSDQNYIEVNNSVSVMIFDFAAKLLFSYESEKSTMNLSEKFINVLKGLMSFPLNIPGTAFHKCLKEYKKALKMIKEVARERHNSPDKYQGDVLDYVIEDMKAEKFLTEDFVAQTMFAFLYTFVSISLTLTLAFKLLSENPDVLQELQAEQEAILKRREKPDTPITWEEYKSMTFTIQVINETLRLLNVAPGLLRRALTDIQVNGYTIPAGWGIMVATSALHLNPDTFQDPLAFNPGRWKDLEAKVVSKNFMPFGGGMKQCAASEYSKVSLAIFLHVLVTKYSWRKIDGGNIIRNPILQFTNAIHVEILKKPI